MQKATCFLNNVGYRMYFIYFSSLPNTSETSYGTSASWLLVLTALTYRAALTYIYLQTMLTSPVWLVALPLECKQLPINILTEPGVQ